MLYYITLPEGHGVMDKALACHAGGRGLNPRQDKEFFSVSEKFKKSAPILSGGET